jgi:hypothetical protein
MAGKIWLRQIYGVVWCGGVVRRIEEVSGVEMGWGGKGQ